MTVDAVFAHLWQSTLVAAGIALVAFAFRRVPAQTRYWVWFAGSLEFMIPFGVLTALGAQLEWRGGLASTPPEWTLVIEGRGEGSWDEPIQQTGRPNLRPPFDASGRCRDRLQPMSGDEYR